MASQSKTMAPTAPIVVSTRPVTADPFVQIAALASLSPHSRAVLIGVTRMVDLVDGATLSEARAPVPGFVVVVHGGLLMLEGSPMAGVVLKTHTLEAGHSVGATCLAGQPPPWCGLRAIGATRVAVVHPNAWDQAVALAPELTSIVAPLLAAELTRMFNDVGLPWHDGRAVELRDDVLNILGRPFIRRRRVVPVSLSAGVLRLAMEHPTHLVTLDEVQKIAHGVTIEPMLTSPEEMDAMLRLPLVQQGNGTDTVPVFTRNPLEALPISLTGTGTDELHDFKDGHDDLVLSREQDLSDVEGAYESAPIVRMVNQFIVGALQRGASDIHVEPTVDRMIVRIRIDGDLEEVASMPRAVHPAISSRLKVIAGMDIAQRRMPQDGRITVMWQNRRIDLRTSTIPAKFGEKVVMRLLDTTNASQPLDGIITHGPTLETFRASLKKPNGIILVTGPTGSGKTTTLYSALAELNTRDVNISTVEDPIEYDLPGVNQVEINRGAGTDFAIILRSFLRQDPDIILVGETRDFETAKIAVEASLTGQLVFTTLHTNSAAASFVRLDEMGIAPYLVGTATICVLAQRLARRVCDGCKVEKPVDPELLASLGIAPGALTRQWEGAGCERCRHLGYKGRVGIFEVMPIDDELRALITKRASASTVHAAAVAKGMLDLPRYGLWLVENGITTLAEVARCVSFDLEMTPEDDHEAPITKREPEGAARVGPDPAHPSHGHRAAHAGATHD